MRRPSASALATLLAVGGAAVFVISQLQPGLLLSNTTPSGGDMGAHVWGPAYVRDHLLPEGRISGWAPDWYAGFPYLTFYFPLPILLIVLVDVVLPYGVAFKLVSVLGLVSLPVAAWAFGRLAGLRAPGPACLAVATVPFLFDRSFTIYGGNIASTLAGEFAFSISLSLALVFLGVVARGLDTGRHRALAACLLALTLLSHVLPTLFAIAGAAVLTLLPPRTRRFERSLTVGVVAGLLTAFWALPLLVRLPYSNDMGWEKLETYAESLFGGPEPWFLLLAAAGAIVSVLFRLRPGALLTAMAVLTAVGFRFAPQGRLWNARLLPFWHLCLYLLAGVAVAELGRGVGRVLSADHQVAGPERTGGTGTVLAPVVALAVALAYVAVPLRLVPEWARWDTDDRSFIPEWVRWNYSGYEAKASYGEYQDLIGTMETVGRDVGCGRAFWEYEPELDRLGTPMALMLLPYWTEGCIGSMEGLYFESSATTPYHFLAQAELSTSPSRPQRHLPYRALDVARGVEHLQLLGARYYMAITPAAQDQARRHPDLRLLATSGPWEVRYPDGVKQRTWEVYEVAGTATVAPLEHEPVVVEGLAEGGDRWLDAAVDWYQDPDRLDVPLAADGPRQWRRVSRAEEVDDLPRQPISPVTVSRIRHRGDRISFEVDRPGSPVLVKTSYFPNWKASGARGPWRVTPNLMAVVPTARRVELRYGTTAVEHVGRGLTLLGLVAVVGLAWRDARRRDRPPRGEEGTGADEDVEEEAEAGLAPLLAEPEPAAVRTSDDG